MKSNVQQTLSPPPSPPLRVGREWKTSSLVFIHLLQQAPSRPELVHPQFDIHRVCIVCTSVGPLP